MMLCLNRNTPKMQLSTRVSAPLQWLYPTPFILPLSLDKCQLTPSPELGTKLEHDEGNKTQSRGDQGQDQTSILRADVVEELRREQRGDSTEGIPHKTLASNSGGGAGAVAVGSVTVGRLKDEVDAEGDGRECDGRADPGELGILGEAVDEETDRQPDGAIHGAIEPGLRVDRDVGIGGEFVVLAHLEVVGPPSQGAADAQTDIWQAADTLGPPTLLGKGDGDDRQEHEGHTPAEGNPEAKGEDHGLGDEHVDGLDG